MKITAKQLLKHICANWYYVTYGDEVIKKLDLLAYRNLTNGLYEYVISSDLYKTMIEPQLKKDDYEEVIEMELLVEKLSPNIFKILDLRKKTTDINKDFENETR